jgi:hypothetical protein
MPEWIRAGTLMKTDSALWAPKFWGVTNVGGPMGKTTIAVIVGLLHQRRKHAHRAP